MMKGRLFQLLLIAVLSLASTIAFQVSTVPKRATSGLKSTAISPRVPRRYRDGGEETEEFVTAGASTAVVEQAAASQHPAATGDSADFPALRSVAMSQVLVLLGVSLGTAMVMAVSGHPIDMSTLHWNGSAEFVSFWNLQLTPQRIAEGVIAAAPMIFLGAQVEESDDRDASRVNFSTMNMVMSLFGRRQHDHTDSSASTTYPPETPMMHALALSVALAAITGLSEEVMFRGILPSAIFQYTQSVPITLAGQALLFGLGHVSQQASFGENKVITGLQATNGLWYGTVYLVTGGDILPCIIAHTLYDIHVFMETWMSINEQMDYTESAVLKRLSRHDEVEIRRIKHEAPSLSTETLAHARRFFYAFDYERRDSLSKSDVQRAVSYAFLHDKVQPSEERVGKLFERMLQQRTVNGSAPPSNDDFQERLRLPEFLRLLFLLKAKSQST